MLSRQHANEEKYPTRHKAIEVKSKGHMHESVETPTSPCLAHKG